MYKNGLCQHLEHLCLIIERLIWPLLKRFIHFYSINFQQSYTICRNSQNQSFQIFDIPHRSIVRDYRKTQKGNKELNNREVYPSETFYEVN